MNLYLSPSIKLSSKLKTPCKTWNSDNTRGKHNKACSTNSNWSCNKTWSQLSGGKRWRIRAVSPTTEFLPLYQCSDQRGDPDSMNSQIESPDCIHSRLHQSSCLLLLYSPFAAQPYHSFLHFPSTGIKGMSCHHHLSLLLFEAGLI